MSDQHIQDLTNTAPWLELWPCWNVGPIRESGGNSGYRAPTNRREKQSETKKNN